MMPPIMAAGDKITSIAPAIFDISSQDYYHFAYMLCTSVFNGIVQVHAVLKFQSYGSIGLALVQGKTRARGVI